MQRSRSPGGVVLSLSLSLGAAGCAALLGLDAGELAPVDGGLFSSDGAAGEDSPGSRDGVNSDGAPTDGTGGSPDGAASDGVATDAPTDTGIDAGAPPHHTADTIVCGTATCTGTSSGPQKCTRCGGLTCIPYGAPQGPNCIISCDDTNPCAPAAQICCGHAPTSAPLDVISGASCATACVGATNARLCDPYGVGECPGPATCKPYYGYFACL